MGLFSSFVTRATRNCDAFIANLLKRQQQHSREREAAIVCNSSSVASISKGSRAEPSARDGGEWWRRNIKKSRGYRIDDDEEDKSRMQRWQQACSPSGKDASREDNLLLLICRLMRHWKSRERELIDDDGFIFATHVFLFWLRLSQHTRSVCERVV